MKPIIVGHRGVSGHYPENTFASVKAAIEQKLEWIEVDIQPTKCGELVVCHDHEINRCSNGRGRVDEHTLEQLQQFDFGGWFAKEFEGQTIMTLNQLLALGQQHELSINIEVKLDKNNARQVVSTLKAQLAESDYPTDKLILSSFSPSVMQELHKQCGHFKLGLISEKLSGDDMTILTDIKAYSCHLDYSTVTPEHLHQLKQAGYKIWCYTVNEPEKFVLLDQVDAIFTDFPERYR